MPIWLTGKLIVIALGSVFALGLGWKAYNMLGNHFVGVANLQQSLANERVEKERIQFKFSVLEATIEIEDAHRIVVEELRETYQAEMTVIREDSQKQKSVLADRERLNRLSKSNPSRLQRLGNRAGEARFNELEVIFNN